MSGKAKQILKSQMKIKDCPVSGLHKRLTNEFGLQITERSLANKISKGSFSGDFFVEALSALGVQFDIIPIEKRNYGNNGSSEGHE